VILRYTAGFVPAIAIMAAVIASPAPKPAPRLSGVIVLDNCDSTYQGKEQYEDNLSLYSTTGDRLFRVSGFNNCESIGSSHAIAVDTTRNCIWVIENVAHRIRRFDFSAKETLSIPEVNGSSLAVDPEIGNVWVMATRGRIGDGHTMVFDGQGKEVAKYDISGWDIAYDGKAKAFWIAEQNLTKVDAATGKVLCSVDVSTWSATSVDVDQNSGAAWVAVGEHPGAFGSRNRLLRVSPDAKITAAVELGTKSPRRVSIDPKDGSAWVASRRSVERFSPEGKSLAEYVVEALAVQVVADGGDFWVVTPDRVQKMATNGNVLT